MKAICQDAYQLLHDGAIALAEVEQNGMRVDVEYVKKAIAKSQRSINRYRKRMLASREGKAWKKVYQRKMNLGSTQQLARVFFDELGYRPTARTLTGRASTSESSLEAIDSPFIKDYFKMKKLEKAQSTYLRPLLREESHGFIHPFFNLHTVQTFRSSSSNPNFQNIPIRNPEIRKLVRRAFIPRPGQQIVEKDFSGIEVGIAACYHKDPKMLDYIHDDSKDMHRDMSGECYLLPQEEITKEIRYCGKNKFVFPQFYGDWYLSCAKALWNAIEQLRLKTVSGVPLKKHLAKHGIKRLGKCLPDEKPRPGTFERHIQKVENRFWEERFPVYTSWKKRWYNKYSKRGYFDMLTGFRCQGYMKRNEVINYPVQGSAFHCLLWSLIELQKEMKKREMKSLLIGQIHDSIVADVVPKEMDEFMKVSDQIMTEQLPEHWPWIIVPIEVDTEAAPIDKSWYEKADVRKEKA